MNLTSVLDQSYHFAELIVGNKFPAVMIISDGKECQMLTTLTREGTFKLLAFAAKQAEQVPVENI